MIELIDYFEPEINSFDLEIEDKEKALNFILNKFKKSKNILDFEKLKRDIFEREKIYTTGVGNGLALPHAVTDAVKTLTISFNIFKKPIKNYDSFDGKPVYIVIMFASNPKDRSLHIQLIGKISRMFLTSDFKERLLKCTNNEELYKILEDFENLK